MIQDVRERFPVPVPPSSWEIREDPLVVDFVINEDNVHTDNAAMETCARAVVSFMDWMQPGTLEYENLCSWMSGPFRKIVRRAHEKEFRKARSHASDVSGAYIGDNVLVFPVRKSSMPDPKVKRLQIKGFDLSETDQGAPTTGLTIRVPERATTGKACAQAAHVAQLLVLSMDDEMLAWWIGANMPIDAARYSADVVAPDVRIEDMGLTEPGTPLVSFGWFPERGQK